MTGDKYKLYSDKDYTKMVESMAKKSMISMNVDVTADIFTYLVNDEILKNLKLKDVGGQTKIR